MVCPSESELLQGSSLALEGSTFSAVEAVELVTTSCFKASLAARIHLKPDPGGSGTRLSNGEPARTQI